MARTWRRCRGNKERGEVEPTPAMGRDHWRIFPSRDRPVEYQGKCVRDDTWHAKYLVIDTLKACETRRRRAMERLAARLAAIDPEFGEEMVLPTGKRLTVRWHFWIW